MPIFYKLLSNTPQDVSEPPSSFFQNEDVFAVLGLKPNEKSKSGNTF